MATIIDSLLVTLGLDAKGMTSGAKAANDSLEQIQASAQKTADAFKKQEQAAADAFKRQQQAALAAFKQQNQAELEAGKISKSASIAAAIAFKQKQTEEASAFKKTQQEKATIFRRNQAEEMKAAKAREAQNKKDEEGLSKIRNEILGIATAVVGLASLKGFAEKIISVDTQVSRLSGTLGVSVETLNAWEMAASKFGATAGEVEDAFRTTNKFQAELAQGSPEAMNKLNEFAKTIASLAPQTKVDYAKLSDKNLDAQSRLIELSKVAAQMSEKDAALALSKLGYSEDFARALHAGNVELAAALEHAKSIDPNLQKASEASKRLTEEWTEIKNRVKGVGDSILSDVSPALETALGGFEKLLDYANKNIPITEGVVTSLGLAVTALGAKSTASAIASVAKLTGGLGEAATAASGLIGLLGNAGLVAAAGAAGYALGSVLSKGIDTLISKMTGADTTLGIFIYDLLHPKKDGGPNQSRSNLTPAQIAAMKAKDAAIRSGQQVGTFDQSALPKSALAKASAPSIDAVQAAQQSEAKYGIPASVTLAQYQLESANGTRMPKGSNNPFGIKAKAGQPFVEAETTEVVNGISQRVMQKFAKFDSLADAFDAHAQLLATGSAYAGARSHKDDPQAFADALTGKYATDPQYGSKLKSIMAQQALLDPSVVRAMQPGPQVDRGIGAGAGMALAANTTSNSTTSNSSQVETNINGPINIHTQSTDAPGIARDIGQNLQTYVFASNANMGLS